MVDSLSVLEEKRNEREFLEIENAQQTVLDLHCCSAVQD
jgi:hypothetical protein